MYEISDNGRPTLPNQVNAVKTTYLVRSLANGYIYYPIIFEGREWYGATVSPLYVEGFENRAKAMAFAKRLEKEKKHDICRGRPPYTRIEVKTDRIEVRAENDESSASDVL